MGQKVALTGNEAAAFAMRQIDPDVVAAYPITPQTEIVQHFSSFVHDGRVRTEFVTVESEHSAMSACIGSAAAGARTMTATCSQGLALMWEMLYIASAFRLPLVMPVVNRALSGPINIHCDHSDAMGARDSGWIQLYSESAQEVYDNLIQAVRIAEHAQVHLPVMVCQDGFVTSHGLENLEIEPDEAVRAFVGEYRPEYHLLDPERPITMGPLALQNAYFEARRQLAAAMHEAKPVILAVAREFEALTGRSYGFFEAYRMADAELVAVALNSTAGTLKEAVDELRRQGTRAGLLKPRVFRPFPWEEMADALTRPGIRAVAVLDRADTNSTLGGPLFNDVRAALFDAGRRPPVKNYIYGLGGRDVSFAELVSVFGDLRATARDGGTDTPVTYLGVQPRRSGELAAAGTRRR